MTHSFPTRRSSDLVGNERQLTALYLLTVADIRGTSPKVWNSWKGKLLEDLYQQTITALGGAQPDTGTVLAQRKAVAATEIRLMGLRDESRSEEHTSELQSLMRNSYAVFCLK